MQFNHPVRELVWVQIWKRQAELNVLWEQMYPNTPNLIILKMKQLTGLLSWEKTLRITKSVNASKNGINPELKQDIIYWGRLLHITHSLPAVQNMLSKITLHSVIRYHNRTNRNNSALLLSIPFCPPSF